MDDLVASKTEIEATEKVLEANGSFTDTRAAFRAYCEFAEFTKTATLPAHSTKSVPLGTSFNSFCGGVEKIF